MRKSISCAQQFCAILALLRMTAVLSVCKVRYSGGCGNTARSANSRLTFSVIDDTEGSEVQPEYSASVIFHWGPSDTNLGSNTYTTGEEIVESASYSYDEEGTYYAGYSVTFGEGSGIGCDGKTFREYFRLDFDDATRKCSMVKINGTDVPTVSAIDTPSTSPPTKRPSLPPITDSPVTASPSKKPSLRPFIDIIIPECGNEICNVDEHDEVCPSDCADVVLETHDLTDGSNDGGDGVDTQVSVEGTIFSVSSKRDAILWRLDIYTNTVGVGRVEVFTREGSYEGYELDVDSWDSVYNNYNDLEGSDEPTSLNLNNGNGVPIRAGSVASFFVRTDGGIRCFEGTNRGDLLANDYVFEVHQGMDADWNANEDDVRPLSIRASFRYDVVKSLPEINEDDQGSEKTMSPTRADTRPPTPPPTIPPTPQPTALPTPPPTPLPTEAAEPGSTLSPTPGPITPAPTTPSLTDATPSPTPNIAGADKSASPTVGLTTAIFVQTFEDIPSKMVLYHSVRLDRTSRGIWRDVTAETIRQHAAAMAGIEPGLVEVEVDFEDQTELELVRMLTGNWHPGRRNMRNLQSQPPLEIEFTTTIRVTSNAKGLEGDELIASGFDTPEEQLEYIIDLKEADTHFRGVETMSLEVDGQLVTGPSSVRRPDNEDGINSIYFIVAGVVGGVLVLIFLISIWVYHARRKRRKRKKMEAEATKSSTTPEKQQEDKVGFEIETKSETMMQKSQPNSIDYFGTIESRENEMDDVSTLGDPYMGDAPPVIDADNTVGESMVSSKEELHVYGIHKYQSTAGMDASRAGGSTIFSGSKAPMVFGDDTTLEDIYRTPNGSAHNRDDNSFQRITVAAPTGKLGIVLDNPKCDYPIVYAIKETSALHGNVRVGDLLLSVDGVDVRGMTTHDVSAFLSSRSKNPERTLVLARVSGVSGNVVTV